MRLIPGTMLVGGALGAGFLVARSIADHVGDENFVSKEWTAGRADIGVKVDESVERIFSQHDTQRPPDFIGEGEWTLKVPAVRGDGSMTTAKVQGAAQLLRAANAETGGDGAVSKAELTTYLRGLADEDGIIRGEDAARVRSLVSSAGLEMSLIQSADPPTGALDAKEAATLLRIGNAITATADGTEYRLQQDPGQRGYALLVDRSDAEHAATGEPWKVLERHASAADAVANLSERGAETFRASQAHDEPN